MFDPEKDQEAEQLIRDYKRVLAFVTLQKDELTAKGVDVDSMLEKTRADLLQLEQVCGEADQAEQQYLQAAADLADVERDVFRETSKMVDHLVDVAPSSPEVQKLVEERNKLKTQFPKE